MSALNIPGISTLVTIFAVWIFIPKMTRCQDLPDFRFNNLYFDSGSALLSPEASGELDSLARYLKAHPSLNLDIFAFSGLEGNDAFNTALSQKRVLAIISYLETKGVNREHLSGRGLGSTHPVAPNTVNGKDFPAGRKQNQRAEIRIVAQIPARRVLYNSSKPGNMNEQERNLEIDPEENEEPDIHAATPAPNVGGTTLPESATTHTPMIPTLAYHYPKRIKQREQKFIFVHVNVRFPSAVKKELQQIISEEIAITTTDDTIVQTISIKPFQFLTVTLKDNDRLFSIDTSFQNSRQFIDTINGNTWRWQISTETTREVAKLVILAVGETKPGEKESVKPKEIPIAISVDYGFWNEIMTYLRKNPEYLVGSILLPLVVFLGKRFFDRRQKDKTEAA